MAIQHTQPGVGGADVAPPERTHTVVVGAGQCGLAVAYRLRGRTVATVVIDENQRVGDQWRHRYDSLKLFTPAQYDGLPGMRFPLRRRTWPTGRQMGDFLESYVDQMALDVRHGTRVTRICRDTGDRFLVEHDHGRIRAHNVVVATGCEHEPRTPAFADQLDPGIRQLHSCDYHNPGQLLPGRVLVVGASHSGGDLALELAGAGHDTWLVGPSRGQIPFNIEGASGRVAVPVAWFAANHLLTLRTPLGRRLQPQVRSHGAPLIRVKEPHLGAAGVHRNTSRMSGVRDGHPLLEDGTVLEVRNVVWCTGFRQDFGFLDLPVIGEDGWPLDVGGVVPSVPGLYFAGLLFQRGFYSMLIGGAGRDATYLADHIANRRTVPARASA